MEDIKDEIYYSELQATLRNYDSKIWQIPAFFTTEGFSISPLIFKPHMLIVVYRAFGREAQE